MPSNGRCSIQSTALLLCTAAATSVPRLAVLAALPPRLAALSHSVCLHATLSTPPLLALVVISHSSRSTHSALTELTELMGVSTGVAGVLDAAAAAAAVGGAKGDNRDRGTGSNQLLSAAWATTAAARVSRAEAAVGRDHLEPIQG